MTEALSARHIHFGYETRLLLENFSLELGEGDFACVLGPNGAGKTTVLRLLSGTLSPQEGSVQLFGESLGALPARKRAQLLAVVPQESWMLFPFTVMEVVLMGRFPHLGILGMESRDDEDLAFACLEEVGMRSSFHRALISLSSGERQRVLIARALAQEPKILLLDEPTTFLDLKHRLLIYEILSRLNARRKLTILTISHDLNLAARYCGKVWLLKEGGLLASGTPKEVLTPELLRQAYETDVEVGQDPRTGTPFIIPYPSQDAGGAS
ncbi:MAG: ABC transporter ATP-binding protein [Acidobacteria bacterium]|nr:ABC transporter ATP-binding protein [Acidobacteriota bacterium]